MKLANVSFEEQHQKKCKSISPPFNCFKERYCMYFIRKKLLLQCLSLFFVLKSNSVTFQSEWYKKLWENWVLKSLNVTSIYILTSLGNCRSMCFEVKEKCSFPLKCVCFTQEYVFLVQTVVWLVNLIFAIPSFQSPLFVAMALDYLTANASPE